MNIGFIGLGLMGRPMAENLLKAGHSLQVKDLRREAAASLIKARRSHRQGGNSEMRVTRRTGE